MTTYVRTVYAGVFSSIQKSVIKYGVWILQKWCKRYIIAYLQTCSLFDGIFRKKTLQWYILKSCTLAWHISSFSYFFYCSYIHVLVHQLIDPQQCWSHVPRSWYEGEQLYFWSANSAPPYVWTGTQLNMWLYFGDVRMRLFSHMLDLRRASITINQRSHKVILKMGNCDYT